MKKLLLTFNLNLICMMVFAQSGTLAGKVTGTNGETIAFVSVAVKGTAMGTQSDERGYFTLSNISPGKQNILISAVGFETVEREISIARGETASLDVVPTEKSINLQTVEIIARKEQGYANSTSFLATKTSSALREM